MTPPEAPRATARQARTDALSQLGGIFGKELKGVRRFGLTRNSNGTPTVLVVLEADVDPMKIAAIPHCFADWPVEVIFSKGTITLQ